jgi:hypothetical protein
MLFLIDIHWQRRAKESDRPQSGIETYAIAGRTFNAAKSKAIRKFNRHFGMFLSIDKAIEKADPAGVFQ